MPTVRGEGGDGSGSRGPELPRRAWLRLTLAVAATALTSCGPPSRPSAPGDAADEPPLRGAIILVDPGHGGLDPGAVGHGVQEKDINLAVGTLLAARLTAAGATVLLTRSGDTEPGIEPGRRRYREGLRARRALALERRCNLVVSIHCNSTHVPAARGPSVFYHRDMAERSLPFARDMAHALAGLSGRRVPIFANGQIVLATAGIPAVNVEIGFLSNPGDARRLADPAYQGRLAAALSEGITRFWAGRSP